MEKSLGEEQRQEFLEEWREAEGNEDKEGDYVIVGGELFSLILPHSHATTYPRVVLPASRREQATDEVHNELGHKSWLPTLRYLQASTVWPGMLKETQERLKQCPHCQANRPKARATQFQITETFGVPFYRVGVDLIGPLPTPVKGTVTYY